ncbi:MAG: AsnC family protein [Candidatus Woesearchaeota archaeon]|jgi:DNA-binding Lrp family transcriptional regulator|nr:AsnC family protein [Candidatus Woesearchaeota archaeon]MDP6265935.1 AsnC family protein [Candidatus Woesearchaeota archaeon]MDP7476328.1 AsnC family protein [Candidatus Woesearchaeota archaeon]HJO02262.1 AsnC family protein [Candidatus Woesearchaeota archaeon]|tara:strand:+ start:496 stop:1047 length:552 start_codon:yes stop_codon:yes gene_type:complete
MEFDEQEKLIIKALIKDPRMSDNSIGKLTKVPIRTVSRKRKKLEQENKIDYYISVNHKDKIRHLYMVKFRMGITKKKLMEEIKKESKVKSLFTEMIYESHFAEIEGHTAELLMIEGKSDNEVSENFNGKILPSMLKNHGQDSIIEIKTIRLSNTIRLFHNYLPFINIKNGKLMHDWHLDSIYV